MECVQKTYGLYLKPTMLCLSFVLLTGSWNRPLSSSLSLSLLSQILHLWKSDHEWTVSWLCSSRGVFLWKDKITSCAVKLISLQGKLNNIVIAMTHYLLAVLDPVLSISYLLSCVIATDLRGRWYCHPHITDEKTEVYRWHGSAAQVYKSGHECFPKLYFSISVIHFL